MLVSARHATEHAAPLAVRPVICNTDGMPPRRRYITVADAAVLIGKSPDTVWRYIRRSEGTGAIATDTADGRLVVDAFTLADYAAKQPGRGRPRTTTTRMEN